MSDALLEVEGLETAYGASQVLFGLSLEIRVGEVYTLYVEPDGSDHPQPGNDNASIHSVILEIANAATQYIIFSPPKDPRRHRQRIRQFARQ